MWCDFLLKQKVYILPGCSTSSTCQIMATLMQGIREVHFSLRLLYSLITKPWVGLQSNQILIFFSAVALNKVRQDGNGVQDISNHLYIIATRPPASLPSVHIVQHKNKYVPPIYFENNSELQADRMKREKFLLFEPATSKSSSISTIHDAEV